MNNSDCINYIFKKVYDTKSFIINIHKDTLLVNFKDEIQSQIIKYYNLQSHEYDIIYASRNCEYGQPINFTEDILIGKKYNNIRAFYIRPKSNLLSTCEEFFCPICRDNHQPTKSINLICSHVFCNECYENFWETNKCPICRRNIRKL